MRRLLQTTCIGAQKVSPRTAVNIEYASKWHDRFGWLRSNQMNTSGHEIDHLVEYTDAIDVAKKRKMQNAFTDRALHEFGQKVPHLFVSLAVWRYAKGVAPCGGRWRSHSRAWVRAVDDDPAADLRFDIRGQATHDKKPIRSSGGRQKVRVIHADVSGRAIRVAGISNADAVLASPDRASGWRSWRNRFPKLDTRLAHIGSGVPTATWRGSRMHFRKRP